MLNNFNCLKKTFTYMCSLIISVNFCWLLLYLFIVMVLLPVFLTVEDVVCVHLHIVPPATDSAQNRLCVVTVSKYNLIPKQSNYHQNHHQVKNSILVNYINLTTFKQGYVKMIIIPLKKGIMFFTYITRFVCVSVCVSVCLSVCLSSRLQRDGWTQQHGVK